MELYILDDDSMIDSYVEKYNSLVWTERYNTVGDFELIMADTRANRAKFQEGVRLGFSLSHRVVEIETVENTVNDEGASVLKFTGRSLEYVLENRVAMPGLDSLTTRSKWEITGKPATVMQQVFDAVCVAGVNSPSDILDGYAPGTFLPLGTIPLPDEPVAFSFEPKSLYETLSLVADTYNLGYRMVRNPATGLLHFEIYTGYNRTSTQNVNPPVIFDRNLDNLTDTKELSSVAVLKNVAYVFAPNGTEVVYPELEEDTSGFERRVLLVKADDINLPAGAELTAALIQKGREELAKHRVVRAFDGQIPQRGGYEYGVDYNLGDIVEKRNSDGMAVNLRVTEQIFVLDETGFKSYPTLSIDQVITAGSWKSWTAGTEWVNAVGTWAEAP